MTTTVPVTAGTLAAEGGRLYYEVRGSGPLLVIVGNPMHSAPFAPLAELMAADHTVLTTDPRGHFGSALADADTVTVPEQRAEDLAALIRHVDAGPAVVFGSSGGAITTTALLQAHPDLVHTAVLHEPPLVQLLDDPDVQRATIDDLVATFAGGDELGAVRKFMRYIGLELPEDMFLQVFGGEKSQEEAASEAYFYRNDLPRTALWRPDTEGLRAVPARIVIGIGDTSAGQLCDRTSRALGRLLDIEPTAFPGGHGGFMEDPTAFAARLRAILV
ncbi:alpha/beta fold hydrolase [Nocardia sp. NPDC052566]|uniref:alpha/beta fold hydrolase n=1 Tax=Nocardia sp. NPDC052566 TaxID=3364330 RepID=UPI0037CAE022